MLTKRGQDTRGLGLPLTDIYAHAAPARTGERPGQGAPRRWEGEIRSSVSVSDPKLNMKSNDQRLIATFFHREL